MKIFFEILLLILRGLEAKSSESIAPEVTPEPTPKPTPAPTPKPTPAPQPVIVKDKWPITKDAMAYIMGRSVAEITDATMDDYTACCETFKLDPFCQAYFLGQCGHESGGLRYAVEWHDGSNYEYRSDLGNVNPGDGVKFAGTGWLQCTGRYNHQRFSDYLKKLGKEDPNIMAVGKTHTSKHYPFTISGFWWHDNKMNNYCLTIPPIDRVGARVNGRYLPNGYEDRRKYSRRAFGILGIPYPGN